MFGSVSRGSCFSFDGERGLAQSAAIERGNYLVNTIMACGNCHTPRGADGKPVTDLASPAAG